MRLEIHLTIDSHPPLHADLLLDNGGASDAIQAPEGLWFEVAATLYEDGWSYCAVTFYEDRRGRRVRLDGVLDGGRLTRAADGPSSPNGWIVGSVSGSSKMYLISAATRLTSAE